MRPLTTYEADGGSDIYVFPPGEDASSNQGLACHNNQGSITMPLVVHSIDCCPFLLLNNILSLFGPSTGSLLHLCSGRIERWFNIAHPTAVLVIGWSGRIYLAGRFE